MKKYSYEARDGATNKIVKSTVQAESENSAAKLLIAQGFSPLDIKLQDENSSFFARLSGRITAKDKIIFMRQLATLIGAGLPLSQSLRTVSEQTSNKKMSSVVQEVIADIEGGKPLSDAFAKHPEVFDQVVIALISAGEASGTLDEALKRIAAQQEKDAAVASKVRGALLYPIIVLFVILGVVIFMLIAVVPQVKNLYKDMGMQLPILTQIMVDGADFLIAWWWLILAVLVIGGYFALLYLKTEAGIRLKDNFKLNVPKFSVPIGMISKKI